MSDFTTPPPPPAPPVVPPPAFQPPPSPEDIHPSNPPKDPALSVILNAIGGLLGVAGIGYFYMGQWQKGLVALIGYWTLVAATALLMTVCIGIFLVPVCIAFIVATAIDAHKQTTFLRAGHTLGQWTMFSTHK